MGDTLVMASPDEAFGERLKALQKQAGLTNEALARKIGTGLRNVQRWRAAEAAPRLDALIDLADALEVSLDDLVGRAAPATSPSVGRDRRRAPLDALEEFADDLALPQPESESRAHGNGGP